MEVASPHFYLAKKNVEPDSQKNHQSFSIWNGYGGRWTESDSSIFTTAVREVKEKSGVLTCQRSLSLCGVVKIIQPGEASKNLVSKTVYFFTVRSRDYSDYPRATLKMGEPRTFPAIDAPYDQMRPADQEIIPIIMRGQTVRGVVQLERNNGTLSVQKKDLHPAYS